MKSPNQALQLTRLRVTAPAATTAFPPTTQVPRRSGVSLSLRSLIWSCESTRLREEAAKVFLDRFIIVEETGYRESPLREWQAFGECKHADIRALVSLITYIQTPVVLIRGLGSGVHRCLRQSTDPNNDSRELTGWPALLVAVNSPKTPPWELW